VTLSAYGRREGNSRERQKHDEDHRHTGLPPKKAAIIVQAVGVSIICGEGCHAPHSATAILVRRKRSDDFTPPWSHRNHRGSSDIRPPLLRLLAPRESRKEHVRCQPAASQKLNPSYLSTAFVIPCKMPAEAIHVTKDHAVWRRFDIRRKGSMFRRSVSRRQDQPRRPAWARHDSRRHGRTVRWTLDCPSEGRPVSRTPKTVNGKMVRHASGRRDRPERRERKNDVLQTSRWQLFGSVIPPALNYAGAALAACFFDSSALRLRKGSQEWKK